MTELCILAQFKAQPGQGDALEAVLAACIPPTRAEAGCRSYTLHRNNEAPEHFAFYEIWADPEALDAHMQTPHLQRLMRDAKPLLAEPFSLAKLHKVE